MIEPSRSDAGRLRGVATVARGGCHLAPSPASMRATLLMCLMAVLGPSCAVANRMSGMSLVHELQQRGARAEALILEVWDTRVSVNDDPVVGFLLEVRPPGAAPYRATSKGPIPQVHIPQFQPGAVIPVLFDPEDPSRVALDVYRP